MRRTTDKTYSISEKEGAIANLLRSRLIAALHIGKIGPGSRLMSIREVAQQYDVDHRVVARAYERLAGEGLVEIRGRSGVFIPDFGSAGEGLIGVRQKWAAAVLADAREQMITFAELHQLMRRVTLHGLRCLCLESTTDHLVACASELASDFGFEVTPIRFTGLANGEPLAEEREGIRSRFESADVIATTTFHAGAFRRWAEDAGKPFVSIIVNSAIRDEIARCMAEGLLRVVIADPVTLIRVKSYMGPDVAPNLRVMLASDYAAHLPNDEVRTLFTKAARRQLGLAEFHLLSQDVPFIAPVSAREISLVIAERSL